MTRFLIHRFLSSIPVLFGIVTAVFVLARVIPGNACIAPSASGPTDEVCDAWNHREGLDRPIFVQFFKYLGNVFTGDFGESFSQRRTVVAILIERLPDHDRAVVPRPHVRDRGRRAARRHRRLPPQLAHRRRDDDRRQRRRLDAGVRARPDAAIPVRRHAQGLVDRAAVERPAVTRTRPDAVLRAVGHRQERRARLHLQLRDAQRAAAVELAHRRRRRPAPRSCPPSPSARSRWRSSPG